MEYQQINNQVSSTEIFNDIERRIKNNSFKTKEELSNYIFNLKERGFLTQEDLQQKMSELLGMYDELNQISEMPLNMENYKGVGLENQNLIVSAQESRILKTLENYEDISKEFKQVQNEIIANNEAALTNADTVFNHMANYQKQELNLIPISEVLSKDNIELEMLQKIKFFISNKYINPYSYKVDLENEIFYNVDTSEVLEVRKDESTNEYHLYKSNEMVYGENHEVEEQLDNDSPVLEDANEEEKNYENRLNPKRRILRPPSMNNYNNAAFSKINFLLLIISMFTISITFLTLLSKFIK